MDKRNKVLPNFSNIFARFATCSTSAKVVLEFPHRKDVDVIYFLENGHAKSTEKIVFDAFFDNLCFKDLLLQIL